jgi:hypothetical protein
MTPNKEVDFKCQPTHGTGALSNPSQPLHPTDDLSGRKRPQNAVFPKKPIKIPRDALESKPIPGSKEYFEQQVIKDNMKKHSPKSENE